MTKFRCPGCKKKLPVNYCPYCDEIFDPVKNEIQASLSVRTETK